MNNDSEPFSEQQLGATLRSLSGTACGGHSVCASLAALTASVVHALESSLRRSGQVTPSDAESASKRSCTTSNSLGEQTLGMLNVTGAHSFSHLRRIAGLIFPALRQWC